MFVLVTTGIIWGSFIYYLYLSLLSVQPGPFQNSNPFISRLFIYLFKVLHMLLSHIEMALIMSEFWISEFFVYTEDRQYVAQLLQLYQKINSEWESLKQENASLAEQIFQTQVELTARQRSLSFLESEYLKLVSEKRELSRRLKSNEEVLKTRVEPIIERKYAAEPKQQINFWFIRISERQL